MADVLKLVSISDLFGMNFFIPSYQRGYRWTKQQVVDLLEDIAEFMTKAKGQDEFYCVQPLVVKQKCENIFHKIKTEAQNIDEIKSLLQGSWDVIDGQQRLTTIHILLSYLAPDFPNKYNIEYETRTAEKSAGKGETEKIGSQEFLAKITNEQYRGKEDLNIDFYHMSQAYNDIGKWFDNHREKDGSSGQERSFKERFWDNLLDKVKFIWYKTNEDDPIKVFTRLNIGKIPLTDSELIKALFLNESNFKNPDTKDSDCIQIRLRQTEVASEWDKIENAFQNDEFWLFCSRPEWNKPTRIDLIFDLICNREAFGKSNESALGNDGHRTFRYFYGYFNQSRKAGIINADWLRKTWEQVKKYFQMIEEWYNDLELYHYVGYLVAQNQSLDNLLSSYNGDKESFKKSLKSKINESIKNCLPLDKEYGDQGEKKGYCRPLLLLHNIQTIINQNYEFCNSEKYKLGIFYKFPFHLFKNKNEHWDVEHIASNAGDDLGDEEKQLPWLASVAHFLPDGDLKKDINSFIEKGGDREHGFDGLKDRIDKLAGQPLEDTESKDKQKIWNFALLDRATNREYQNAPFPCKRVFVLSKEQGRKAKINYDKKQRKIAIDRSEKAVAFVPPCTKNIFIKAYTDIPTSMNVWSKVDAIAYMQNIEQMLMEYIYPEIYFIPSSFRPALSNKNRLICNIPEAVLSRYIEIVNKIYNTKQNEQ